MYEKITNLKKKIQAMKKSRLQTVYNQIFKFKPFSKKQKQVLTWWCATSPVKDYDGIIADGAIRSGKTVCMSLSYVMWAMETFNGQNFAMCGKTIGSFRRNVLFWLKLMLKARGYGVVDHRADNLIVITRGKTTNNFYIFGGRDESSQDLIQGITLAGVFFDEVALMPESFVNQATGRCSVDGSKFWFNCNPSGPYHWFKVNWIDRAVGYIGKERAAELRAKGEPVKNILYVHFVMDDNLSLSEEIKERYRNSATALSGGSWSTTAPTWVNGKYMWSRTVTTDGAGNKTYSPNQNGVCIAGAKGETGNDGKNALQPKRNWSGTFTTIGETANVSTSSFNRTPVVGDVFTNLDGSSNTGTWEITKIENGNAFFKLLSYVSSKGATGATGATGKGVSSIVEQYYKSTSATALSGGSWSTTYPGWESGKYIWTRSVITYTDGNAITTNPICVSGDKGNDGINGTNLWINPLFESDKPQIGTRDTSIKAPNGSAVNLIDKRDNYNSSANFPVFPGHSYRITVHRKKKSGSVNLKAGIWYIAQTSGYSFDTYVDAYSTKNLSDGWQEAVYNITCPNGKSKGCVFLQLEKTSTTNTDAAWYVANIICTDITGLKGDKGDTGAKQKNRMTI